MAEASVKNVEAVRKGLLAVVSQDRQQSLAYRDCQTGCFRVRAVLCGFAYLRSAAATRGRKGRTAFWGNRRSASTRLESVACFLARAFKPSHDGVGAEFRVRVLLIQQAPKPQRQNRKSGHALLDPSGPRCTVAGCPAVPRDSCLL